MERPVSTSTFPEGNSHTSHSMQRQAVLNKCQPSNTCTTTARELPVRTSTFLQDKVSKQICLGHPDTPNTTPADTGGNKIEQELSFLSNMCLQGSPHKSRLRLLQFRSSICLPHTNRRYLQTWHRVQEKMSPQGRVGRTRRHKHHSSQRTCPEDTNGNHLLLRRRLLLNIFPMDNLYRNQVTGRPEQSSTFPRGKIDTTLARTHPGCQRNSRQGKPCSWQPKVHHIGWSTCPHRTFRNESVTEIPEALNRYPWGSSSM